MTHWHDTIASIPTFDERLAEYRAGLEWQEDHDDYLDSLDGRGGICARDAAAEYADTEQALREKVADELSFTIEMQRKRA